MFGKNKDQFKNKLSIVSKRTEEIRQRIEQVKNVELKVRLKEVLAKSIDQYKEDFKEGNLFLRFTEIENTICRNDSDKNGK